jgi:hypothetical protein
LTKALFDQYDLGINRTNYMLYILRHLSLILMLLVFTPAYAADTDEESIRQFFNKIQNLMNKREINDIESFYKYYADSSARFIKTSYLLDPTDKSKVLAQESLNMSKNEYIKYIKDILKPLNNYAYRSTISNITIDKANSIALISYGIEEYSLIKAATNSQPDDTTFISANCNMNLSIEGGDTSILSTNCIEKIVKKN